VGIEYVHGYSTRESVRLTDLYRTAEADGTFCYTFFKAVGIR
jgi:hypothetical protein